MSRTLIFFLFLIISNSLNLFSQSREDVIIEKLIEEIAENSDEETDYTSLTENLFQFYSAPININSTSYEELIQLLFLTDYQVKSLLEYVKNKGPIVSVYEIQYVYGFDLQMVKYLEPFITLGVTLDKNKSESKNIYKYGRHEFYIQAKKGLESSSGYQTVPDSILSENPYKNRYLGDPVKYRLKYTFRSIDKIYFGIQAEKEAGEEFFKGSNKQGFDFYSGYLQLKNRGIIKNLTIGDYQLQFGQGLTLWNGLATGKSAFTGVSKIATGIKRYGSSDEYNYFRGVAGTIKVRDLEFTAFLSIKKTDVNIIDTVDNGDVLFSSFQTTGYHRTPLEIEDEKSITETAFGSNINLKKENFEFGATVANYNFNAIYQPELKPYNQSGFQGSTLTNFGIDYRFRLKKILFFGEVTNGNKNWAILSGAELNLHPLVSLSILYRNYSDGFFAYRNNPFSEYSSKNNERGTYVGTTIYPFKYFKLTAYFDVFKSPWLRYNVNSPSFGKESFVQLDFTPNRKFYSSIRFKSEIKCKNFSNDSIIIPYITNYTLNKTRIHFEYQLTSTLRLRNRFEWSVYKEENSSGENGILFFQDIIFTPEKFPFSVWLRYNLFSIQSYESRIYTYENSMLYSFSVPSFFNNGMRSYIMLKFKPCKIMDAWVKYGISEYYNQNTTGSGLDEIPGNIKSEIEVMIKFKI